MKADGILKITCVHQSKGRQRRNLGGFLHKSHLEGCHLSAFQDGRTVRSCESSGELVCSDIVACQVLDGLNSESAHH